MRRGLIAATAACWAPGAAQAGTFAAYDDDLIGVRDGEADPLDAFGLWNGDPNPADDCETVEVLP